MTKIKTKRIFLALSLPEYIKEAIGTQAKSLENNENVRMVKADSYHITLLFIGTVVINSLDRLEECLDKYRSKNGPISFVLSGPFCFPDDVNPHVLAVGCRQTGGKDIFRFQQMLKEDLEKPKFLPKDMKALKPHITAGRVKGRAFVASDWLSLQIEQQQFTVDSFDLIESKLTSNGAYHSLIRRYEI